jgi:alkanesulfonate monooxygenase SsuD/methylene tetrahydromethanopterin reductase-like flavin-dependent oxidoreductase (luciferase family)
VRTLATVAGAGGHPGPYELALDPHRSTLDTARRVAERAEAARIDALFVPDLLVFGAQGTIGAQEPLIFVAALSQVTKNAGLIATVSTTFHHPFNLARMFGTLDHVSNGRAAWNLVTSSIGEQNFGAGDLPSPEQRYARRPRPSTWSTRSGTAGSRVRCERARTGVRCSIVTGSGRSLVADMLGGGVDLCEAKLDGPLPDSALPDIGAINRRRGRAEIFSRLIREGRTLRELIVAAQDTGHWNVAGTPEQLADAVEERFRAGVLDVLSVGGLADDREHDFVVNGLLAELRRRGVVKPDYLGPTLRENLGL